MDSGIDRIEIYKDGWIVSRPWNADIFFKDGVVWKSWQCGCKTKKGLIEAIKGYDPEVQIVQV
jgi:hypothetical protein